MKVEKIKNTRDDNKIIKYFMIFLALIYIILILIIPIVSVFFKAFENGVKPYIDAITDEYTIKALKLTLLSIGITVPINTIFGIVAAYAIAKFEFKGKSFLLAILDLPFAVSPVIAGLIFILLFSTNHGYLGEFLNENNIKIIFSKPGIIIATLFVTMPFVAKELIPLMESLGNNEEEAAITLGASGWKTFLKVTLPNIKWGLFYGVILATSRAAGEFGAVSVVSGHIRGLTNTIPLHIEVLYNEYQYNSAFSVASILTIIAVINLIIKNVSEWKVKDLNKIHESVEES